MVCLQVWYCLLVAPQVQAPGRVVRNSTSHPPSQAHQVWVWVVGMPPPPVAPLVQMRLVGWWAVPAQQPGLVLVGHVVGALSTPRMIPPPHTLAVVVTAHTARRLGALVHILVVVLAPPPASVAGYPGRMVPPTPRVGVVVVQVVG